MNYVTIIAPNYHLSKTKFDSYLERRNLFDKIPEILESYIIGYPNVYSNFNNQGYFTCTISFPWGHDDSHHLICNLVALVVFIWTNPSIVGIRAWHGVDHLVVINQPALFRVDIQLFKTFRVMNSAIKKISWKNKVVSIFADVFKNFRYIFYHYSPHLVRKFMQLRKWFCQQKMTGRKISPSWHFAAAAYGNLRRRSIPPQTKLHLGFMRDFPAKKTLEW